LRRGEVEIHAFFLVGVSGLSVEWVWPIKVWA